jgi:hypothetical protein
MWDVLSVLLVCSALGGGIGAASHAGGGLFRIVLASALGVVAGLSGVIAFEALIQRAGDRVLPVVYVSKMIAVVVIGILICADRLGIPVSSASTRGPSQSFRA